LKNEVLKGQVSLAEEQIIGVLKEAEAGMKVAEVCRKYGISDATYYNWKPGVTP
jgi:putative transposase